MTDKKPTIGDVLDKLGITFSDWRTIKWEIVHAIESAEIVLCGGDRRNHTCGECGYWSDKHWWVPKCWLSGCKNGHREELSKACPDFIPREVPHDR